MPSKQNFCQSMMGIDFVQISLVIFKLTKNVNNIKSHVEITILLNWNTSKNKNY